MALIRQITDERASYGLDCCDREVMSYVATTGGISGDMIRDLMMKPVEYRFGKVDIVPQKLQWLSDNDPAYFDRETRSFAEMIGIEVGTTPYRSPESNGMAESFVKTFKRDGGYDTVIYTGGGIGLSGGKTLTINGGANDYFIFNLAGGMSLTDSFISLSGGITADHVLFYNNGADGISGANSVLNGTYYSNAQIQITGGTVNGALIAPKIFDPSGSAAITVNADPYDYGYPVSEPVPEPATMLLLGSALAGLAGVRRKFKK